MGAVQVTTLFDSDEAENEYMKGRTGLSRVEGTEAERLAAEGYLPCGLSQTGRVCPDCGSFLGRFREGIAGMRYYDTAKQRSRMAETVQTELYFCRNCRRTYA